MLGLAAIAQARLVEPRRLQVRHLRVPIPAGARTGGSLAPRGTPLRLLHLSDLHVTGSASLELVERAVHAGLEQRPHLSCLTGDYLTAGAGGDPRDLARALRPLVEAGPVIAILGNHDGGSWSSRRGGHSETAPVVDTLEAAGCAVLSNAWRAVAVAGWRLAVAGTGDLWAGQCDPAVAFQGWDAGAATADARMVLAHNPDSKEALRAYPWDLLLCGHTHGGQVVLPLIGPPVVPVRDRRFVAGLNAWDQRWIHTSRGVGSILGLRFNCRPDVTILELSPAGAGTPSVGD